MLPAHKADSITSKFTGQAPTKRRQVKPQNYRAYDITTKESPSIVSENLKTKNGKDAASERKSNIITEPSSPQAPILSKLSHQREEPRVSEIKLTEKIDIPFSENQDFKNINNFSTESRKISAAVTIQKWWRGEIARYIIAAKLISEQTYVGDPWMLNFVSKIPLSRKIKMSYALNIPKPTADSDLSEKLKLDMLRKDKNLSASTAASRFVFPIAAADSYKPWPRHLLNALTGFLAELDPNQSSYCNKVNSVECIYRKSQKYNAQPFAFSIEKKALKQLAISRKARKNLSNLIEKNN